MCDFYLKLCNAQFLSNQTKKWKDFNTSKVVNFQFF